MLIKQAQYTAPSRPFTACWEPTTPIWPRYYGFCCWVTAQYAWSWRYLFDSGPIFAYVPLHTLFICVDCPWGGQLVLWALDMPLWPTLKDHIRSGCQVHISILVVVVCTSGLQGSIVYLISSPDRWVDRTIPPIGRVGATLLLLWTSGALV